MVAKARKKRIKQVSNLNILKMLKPKTVTRDR